MTAQAAAEVTATGEQITQKEGEALQLSGNKDFPTSPSVTYALFTNPDVLIRAMPGLKSLTPRSETSFDAELEVGVAGIKGTYQGTLNLQDIRPGEGYRMVVHGEGPMGFMDAEVTVNLEESSDGGTAVSYQGDAKVGGTVAGVGQRMLSGVSKIIIGQFFNGILKEARKAGSAS